MNENEKIKEPEPLSTLTQRLGSSLKEQISAKRRQQKLKTKLKKPDQIASNGKSNLARLEAELASAAAAVDKKEHPHYVPPPLLHQSATKLKGWENAIARLTPTRNETPQREPETPRQHTAGERLRDAINASRQSRLPWETLRAGVMDGSISSAIADSGAASSCGKYEIRGNPFKPTGRRSDKIFQYAGGEFAPADEIMHLPFQLRGKAKEIHMVPGIGHHLFSTNRLAESGYATIFDGDEVNVYDLNNTTIKVSRSAVLKGWRDVKAGIWRIPLTKTVTNANTDTLATAQSPQELLQATPPLTNALNVYEIKKQPELVRYYHAAAGFPTKPTWLAAINNSHYASWPGLTATLAAKYFPESAETWKGHGRKIKSGLRSTKQSLVEQALAEELEFDPAPATTKPKQNNIYTKVYNLHDDLQRKIYTDQTGTFPVQSYSGKQYIMILVELDSSSILSEGLSSRKSGEMVRAYNTLVGRLKESGIEPKTHLLDNECSQEFKDAIKANKMTFQLVPPHDHRRNVAEKAIQTFKAHFVAVLCGTATSFPVKLWCRLLRPAEDQLNMLRKSRVVPAVSAFAHLYGQHDYDANPWAPLGTEVELYVHPSQRKTWGAHTLTGFYIGNARDHYRCHVVWLPETRRERIGQTVFFKHRYLTQEAPTNSDAILKATGDLDKALSGVLPTKGPTKEALDRIISSLKGHAKTQETKVDEQRRSRAEAQSQRVEVEYPTTTPSRAESPPMVSQDDASPSQNTRAANQQRLTSALEIAGLSLNAKQASRRRFPLAFFCTLAAAVLDGATGELMEYRHLIKHPKYKQPWKYSFGNEIGRLAQGMPERNNGTDTIQFINKSDVPDRKWKELMNCRIVCNERPQKAEVNRTRLTVDGSRIKINGDISTPTAVLQTVKLLLNSIVSTPNAKFLGLDLKDFYLNTPLPEPEYLRMKMSHFPQDVIDHYNLEQKADANGTLYVRVSKGIYGLPHAGILAQKLLEKRLNNADYYQSDLTPGFWKHKWRPISFTLIVDDFGVKYVGEQHANHLIEVLKGFYDVSEDWKGEKYAGITMDWDYEKRQVHLSMPGYVKEALVRFKHKLRRKTDQPHRHEPPKYGATIQYAKEEDSSDLLNAKETQSIQQITGTFLYYARAVDPTMLVALSAIASMQSKPTVATLERAMLFLDYAATHPDAIMTYKASNMILHVHSDASYLTEPKARSRAGGHFFLSSKAKDAPNNGAVHNIAQILKHVMTSAADAEIGALYVNTRHAISVRRTLEEMGHPQPATPVQTDNTTALGFVTKNIQPKLTKSTDMKHWSMRDKEERKQFEYGWTSGKHIKGDYYTKHFCSAHHRQVRQDYLTARNTLDELRTRLGQPCHVYNVNERVC